MKRDIKDFDASVFLVTKNGEVIYKDDIDKKDARDGVFVMLMNDMLNPDYGEDHIIYVSVDCAQQIKTSIYSNAYNGKGIKWSVDVEIPNLRHVPKLNDFDSMDAYLDGYRDTMDIILNCPKVIIDENGIIKRYNELKNDGDHIMHKEQVIPAVMYAYNSIVVYDDMGLCGYLPAAVQNYIVSFNINDVNSVLTRCNKGLILTKEVIIGINRHYIIYEYLWSSTVKDKETAYLTSPRGIESALTQCFYFPRTYVPIKVLPMYKIK